MLTFLPAPQERGVALVRLEGLGVETAVNINRPAAVGERLRLRCLAAEPRTGFYRLDEAPDPGLDPNGGSRAAAPAVHRG